jgi:hypothetical protein
MLVSDSTHVQIDLPQTVQGVLGLSTEAYPETVTIDGTPLPLRLTPEQAAAILASPVGEEIFQG